MPDFKEILTFVLTSWWSFGNLRGQIPLLPDQMEPLRYNYVITKIKIVGKWQTAMQN